MIAHLEVEPRLIDGRICWPCRRCEVAWTPMQGPDLCAGCRARAATVAIDHPSQWHPDGWLAAHAAAARARLADSGGPL